MRKNLLGVMALTAALSMGFSNDAMADNHGVEGIVDVVIEDIGIGSLDDIYGKVKEIDTKVTNAADDIAATRKKLKSALNTAEGTSLEAAAAEFQAKAGDMIKITGDVGSLKIGFDPEAPEDIQKIVGALNDAVANLDNAKTKLGEVPGKMAELSEQAAAMADMKKFKAEAKNAGIKAKEVPALLKKVKANNTAMKAVPPNSQAVVGEADKVLNVIKSFGG